MFLTSEIAIFRNQNDNINKINESIKSVKQSNSSIEKENERLLLDLQDLENDNNQYNIEEITEENELWINQIEKLK